MLVLGLGTILTIIGLGSLAATRAGTQTTSDSADWSEAKVLAFAAVDHAITQINRNSSWRTTFNNVTTQPLGRGTFSWHVTDDSDNNLADDPSEPFTIWATGTVRQASYSMKVHMTPPANGGGLSAGVVVSGAVKLTGSCKIDSYDSTLGAYGGANISSNATVLTNSTASKAVSLAWSTAIKGSVQVGPGGNPDTVIDDQSGTNVTGTMSAMGQQAQMPTLTAPSMGASTGDKSISSAQGTTISGNLHVNNLSVTNSGLMKVSGTTVILVENNFSVSGAGVIEVLPNSSLTIYVKGTSTMSGGTRIDGPNLSNIKLMNLGTGLVDITGSSQFQGVIMSPNGAVTIENGAAAFGAVMAKQISILGGSQFHQDLRISTCVDRVTIPGATGTGGPSKPQADSWNRVVN